MYFYHCLNPIAQIGLRRFPETSVNCNRIQDADVVLVRSASMHELELPEKVIAVARAGAGVNNIPLDAYASKGVVVFNTPGANANGVKELVFAGMLLAARDIVGGINYLASQTGREDIATAAEKEKKRFAGSELSGKKLGVIGLGAIGVLVANAAVHLGMEVYGYDPYISVDAAWNLSRSIRHINEIDRIYEECDYITIHVPLNEHTRGMIGESEIARMKKNAVLLNYARDQLVDEKAVLDALYSGRIHRYVSDFPNPVTNGAYGVILTPHMGASTAESEDNCAKMAVDQLRDYVENGNIRNSVNYPECNMGRCQSASRIAILHSNKKQMISRFTSLMKDTNIANMSNSSRGAYAYTLFDLEDRLSSGELEALTQLDDVYRVRIVC